MTAVVGIMNKRGIAIAADSAVTMSRDGDMKIANSANKMIRMSSAQPVSVMIVGNACFLDTPWDIIVRRYRQKRGNISLDTVESYVEDFLAYIPTEKQLLNLPYEEAYVLDAIDQCFNRVDSNVPLAETDDEGNITNINEITQAFQEGIAQNREEWKDAQSSPAFKGYTIKKFKKYVSKLWNQYIEDKATGYFCIYPKELFAQIKDDFLEIVFTYLTTYRDDNETLLVFCGFGADEDYPSLIAVKINEGFDGRVCYKNDDKDRVNITDNEEAAICPYAQSDIMRALLTGVNPGFKREAFNRNPNSYEECNNYVQFHLVANDELTEELETAINKVKYKDLCKSFISFEEKREKESWQSWLKVLKNYDLQDMAHLAENLVAITSFERHVTFKQEGVGGPIDLAVITKNDGFVWLNRKSWYNHQDVGGRYGKFGV